MAYKNPEDAKRWHENNKPRKRAYMRQYSKDNRAAVTKASLACVRKKPEQYRATKRAWALKNKDKVVAIKAAFAERHKDRLRERAREYQVQRRERDANFKILGVLRCRLYAAIKIKGGIKAARTMELVGCTLQFLRGYLEARFQPGMTWENHGEWHIDHRIPCAEFDLRDKAQQLQCFNYTNLQPLWAADNLRKSGIRPPTHQPELL